MVAQIVLNVTSTSSPTKIFFDSYGTGKTLNFTDVVYNGTSIFNSLVQIKNSNNVTLWWGYTFPTTGHTTLELTLAGDSLNNSLRSNENLYSVIIPEGVTGLTGGNFMECQSLSEVTLPSTLVSLGNNEFKGAFTANQHKINCYATTAPAFNPKTESPTRGTFLDIRPNGYLVYPAGSDYSSWLSNDAYCLGYYGWNSSTVPNIYCGLDGGENTLSFYTGFLRARCVCQAGCVFDRLESNTVYTPFYDGASTVYGWLTPHLHATCGCYPDEVIEDENPHAEVYGFNENRTGQIISADTAFNFYDTSGNCYTEHFITYLLPSSTSGLPDEAYIRVGPFSASVGCNETYVPYEIYEHRCQLSSYTYTNSNPDFPVSIVSSGDGLAAYFLPNTGAARSTEVTFDFTDTNGNVYLQTVIINQYSGSPSPSGTAVGFTVQPTGIARGANNTYGPFFEIRTIPENTTANIGISVSGTLLNAPANTAMTVTDYGTTISNTPTFINNSVGESSVIFTDLDTGYQVVQKIYRGTSGSTPHMEFNPFTLSVQTGTTDITTTPVSIDTSVNTTVVASNCTFDNFLGTSSGLSSPDTTIASGGAPIFYYARPYAKTGNTIPFGFAQSSGTGWEIKEQYLLDTDGGLHLVNIKGELVLSTKDITVSPSASTPTSADTSITLTVSATDCTLSSYTYDSSNENFPVTATTSGDDIILEFDENDGEERTTTVTFVFTDEDGNTYTDSITITQEAASGSERNLYLDASAVTVNYDVTNYLATVIAENCTYDHFNYSTGGSFPISAVSSGSNGIYCTFSANTTGQERGGNLYITLYDTDGNTWAPMLRIVQRISADTRLEPDPWTDPGDSAYTWYTDDNLLKVLPEERILAWDEESAYYPVTARSFDNVGVRSSGDCPFTYSLNPVNNPGFNDYELYCYTEDYSGDTQLASKIKLVAFSGTSAYSASTMLLKNPASEGWITVSPDPLNAVWSANSLTVYLTLTNCERSTSDEATANTHFDSLDWISITNVNSTAATFNFSANTGEERSTYYLFYGRDIMDRPVIRRLEISQSGFGLTITITPDRSTLTKESGSFTCDVKSTMPGTFSFSASPWLSVTRYVPSSSTGGTLYVDYSENQGGSQRTGTIWATEQIQYNPYQITASTQVTQTVNEDSSYIRVNPEISNVTKAAGIVEVEVEYSGLTGAPVLVEGQGNMNIISSNFDGNIVTISYGANDTSIIKSKTFTLTGTSSNGNRTISKSFTINQGGTGVPVAPVWRDYVVSVDAPGNGYINYIISHDGQTIYTGRAYAMGENNIYICLNQLIKSYLSNYIDFTEGYQTISDWLGDFMVSSPELGNIINVSFYEDYSYENRDVTNVMTLNNPITNEVVEGGYVPFSFFVTGESGSVSITQDYAGETGQTITGLTISDNEQHRYFIKSLLGRTYHSLGSTYKTIPMCEARYSIYYVNSYGGVDVLPFKGRSNKKTDNITRLNYSKTFWNNSLEFENVNYMNEIKSAWELQTGWMSDEQSKKMNEIVESTCAFLYDAEEQKYTPIVMTDKKLEYKTFKNQNNRFYNYTINVEESQSKERR